MKAKEDAIIEAKKAEEAFAAEKKAEAAAAKLTEKAVSAPVPEVVAPASATARSTVVKEEISPETLALLKTLKKF